MSTEKEKRKNSWREEWGGPPSSGKSELSYPPRRFSSPVQRSVRARTTSATSWLVPSGLRLSTPRCRGILVWVSEQELAIDRQYTSFFHPRDALYANQSTPCPSLFFQFRISLDFQSKYFDGWPKENLPIKYLNNKWRDAVRKKCTDPVYGTKLVMPNLPPCQCGYGCG